MRRRTELQLIRVIATIGWALLFIVCSPSNAVVKPLSGDATPSPSETSPPAAQSPSGSPDQSSPDGPPPLNSLEVKIIDALAELGVQAQRAELPYQNAEIWAQFANSSFLAVHANPVGTTRSEFTVIDERTIEGVVVRHVRYASSPPIRDRFECGQVIYEVEGSVPPGFDDMEQFLAAFILRLECKG